MLTKKENTDAGEMAYFKSSQIIKSLYDDQTEELIIHFAKGGMYSYRPVSSSIYNSFLNSDSQGKIFKSLIKDNTRILCNKIR